MQLCSLAAKRERERPRSHSIQVTFEEETTLWLLEEHYKQTTEQFWQTRGVAGVDGKLSYMHGATILYLVIVVYLQQTYIIVMHEDHCRRPTNQLDRTSHFQCSHWSFPSYSTVISALWCSVWHTDRTGRVVVAPRQPIITTWAPRQPPQAWAPAVIKLIVGG